MASNDQAPWGRVDDTGTVFVREADGEREVGQYPDGTAEEALAYFERKFTELAGQVTLLEQRAKREGRAGQHRGSRKPFGWRKSLGQGHGHGHGPHAIP